MEDKIKYTEKQINIAEHFMTTGHEYNPVQINESEKTKTWMAYIEADNNKPKINVMLVKPNVKISDMKDMLPTDLYGLQGGGAYITFDATDKSEAIMIAKLKLKNDMVKLGNK